MADPTGPDIPYGPPQDLTDPLADPVAALQQPPLNPGEKVLKREYEEPPEARKALVTSLQDMIKQAKSFWDKPFRRMERDQKFAYGQQWQEESKTGAFNDAPDDRYMANITLRHIQMRVASLYAKNPKATSRKRNKLLAEVWDGSMQTLQQAQQTLQMAQMAAQQAMMMGAQDPSLVASMMQGQMPQGQPQVQPGMNGQPQMGPDGQPVIGMQPPPQAMMPPPQELMHAQTIVTEAQQVKVMLDQMNRMGKTLEILYDYEIDEQQQSFKSMMKMTVRRAATAGVGWIRLGFQRVMGPSPDKDSRIADMKSRLDLIERISADIADNEEAVDSASAEEMRLALQAMSQEQDIVLREGLMFSWPKSTAIIPDPRCTHLRDFLGCDWVVEEYCLTPNEIQETYGIDVGDKYTSYDRIDTGMDYERARQKWAKSRSGDDPAISSGDKGSALVWEMFNKKDGLVYVLCDGFCDFLREPAAPDVYTDRFWPWFVLAFNEADGSIYPPSDVSLVRPMQLELNRSRQGLREHRFANRPKTVYADGRLSEEDLESLRTHPVNALIAISGLQPGEDVNQLIQALKGAPIDPNLYEVNPVFQDLLRTVGDQQADLGGTAGGTATETSYAAGARATATGSSVDDIDDTLTAIARAAGQILLLNVSEETVKEIVGPGAMWPSLTKAQVSKDLYLEIEAGSSGRPNQQQELQNFERLAPILMQLPGITPQFVAKEAVKRLDDTISIEDVYAEGMPSVVSQNGGTFGAPTAPGGEAPGLQGPQGANNTQGPPRPNSGSPTPMNSAPPGEGQAIQ